MPTYLSKPTNKFSPGYCWVTQFCLAIPIVTGIHGATQWHLPSIRTSFEGWQIFPQILNVDIETERWQRAHRRYNARDFENVRINNLHMHTWRRNKHLGNRFLGKWQVYQKRRHICFAPDRSKIFWAQSLTSCYFVSKPVQLSHPSIRKRETTKYYLLPRLHPRVAKKKTRPA